MTLTLSHLRLGMEWFGVILFFFGKSYGCSSLFTAVCRPGSGAKKESDRYRVSLMSLKSFCVCAGMGEYGCACVSLCAQGQRSALGVSGAIHFGF